MSISTRCLRRFAALGHVNQVKYRPHAIGVHFPSDGESLVVVSVRHGVLIVVAESRQVLSYGRGSRDDDCLSIYLKNSHCTLLAVGRRGAHTRSPMTSE